MLVAKSSLKRCIQKIQKIDNSLKLSSEYGNLFILPKSDKIIKIVFVKNELVVEMKTPMMEILPDFICWTFTETENSVEIKTSKINLVVCKNSGKITYYDNKNNFILTEAFKEFELYDSYISIESDNVKSRIIDTPDGKKTIVEDTEKIYDKQLYRSTISFDIQDDEMLFGLGQNENGEFNLVGTTQYLVQKNMRIAIPFIQSTNNYALLIDTAAPMIYESTLKTGTFYTEADMSCSYYFIYGENFDEKISGYRTLTGKTALLPKWAYGFVQSMERYETAQEMIDTVQKFRDENIGIDCIVLDWQSWEGELWGQKTFDKTRFPNPADMMNKLHNLNSHLMISVWPNMRKGGANYNEMKSHKMMLPNSEIYNAFDENTRKTYWKQANDGLFSYGIDAWWCDSSEPVCSEWGHLRKPSDSSSYYETFNQLINTMPAELSNAYTFFHSKSIYDGQRETNQDKRVCNLTRSAYLGQQKLGCCMWSGDTAATWDVFKNQLVAGLQFSASGIPFWTFDIGAFFVKNGVQWFWNGDYENGCNDLAYAELYTRWYQAGAFMPMFRSHGTDTRREIWNFRYDSTDMFYNAQKNANQLRYKLLPTIYSMAYKTWKYDFTMLRMLAFDFANDKNACNIKDQFMFGKNILVCPVTKPMYYEKNSSELLDIEKTCKVYLPVGKNWTDFHTGKIYEGGQTIVADATIDKLPIYIASGSILFTNEFYNYANENIHNEIDVTIFGGDDICDSLFIDDGDNYSYENDNYCEIKFNFDEKNKILKINKAVGKWLTVDKSINLSIKYNNQNINLKYTGDFEEIKFN